MPLYPIAAPDHDDVLTLAAAKAHLRVDFNDDDELIESYIATAIENVDGRDGWLGRALAAQTWELRLADFCGEIAIPLPPLIEVLSVSYYDASDALQTVPSTDYEVVGIGGFGKARLVLRTGKRWPSTGTRAENVIVRFALHLRIGVAAQQAVCRHHFDKVRRRLARVRVTAEDQRQRV